MQGLGILSPADESELRISEERLAMPSASESRESLGALLAEDFCEFGSSDRITDATSTLDALIAGGRPRIMFEEFKATPVADGVVLVTYVSRSVWEPGWKPTALRSSLWIRREGRWQIVFHQGTRLLSGES
jgi:hypothetical protein